MSQRLFFLQPFIRPLCIISFLVFLSSCTISTQDSLQFIQKWQKTRDNPQKLKEQELTAINSPIYRVIPRHRKLIPFYHLPYWISWSLFGNDDDGIFGEGAFLLKENEDYNLEKTILWNIRNPLHNFTFYVIGQAYLKRQSEITLLKLKRKEKLPYISLKTMHYKKQASTVFASSRSSFYFALHGFKPFLSIRLRPLKDRRSDFYIGWRERGNFGIKLIPLKKDQTLQD